MREQLDYSGEMGTIGGFETLGKSLVSSADVDKLLAAAGDVPEILIEACQRFGYARTYEAEMSNYNNILDEIKRLVKASA